MAENLKIDMYNSSSMISSEAEQSLERSLRIAFV